jgi:hypothetical protein
MWRKEGMNEQGKNGGWMEGKEEWNERMNEWTNE